MCSYMCLVFLYFVVEGDCSWASIQKKPAQIAEHHEMYLARIMFWDFMLTDNEIHQIYNVSIILQLGERITQWNQGS